MKLRGKQNIWQDESASEVITRTPLLQTKFLCFDLNVTDPKHAVEKNQAIQLKIFHVVFNQNYM